MNKHTAQLLEKHFDAAFAAPDGIKKLRELILTLAMQGKLVPQDPSDQPASELLREIELEKQRLAKEGKIKMPKPLLLITEQEKPYALPLGWEWVCFPDCYFGIGSKINQIQATQYQEEGDFPVVDQGKTFISGYTDDRKRLLQIEKPVIVFGDHTKNIKYIDFNFVIGADGVKVLCPYRGIKTDFLFRLMQSYDLTDRGYARHFKILNAQLAPLPPTEEQGRITKKINELMNRCDELEKLRAAQNEKRLTVHTAAIKQLLNIAEPGEHQRAQAFLAKHFGALYTVKENVAELRKAILQLAVMGKLVPQDVPSSMVELKTIATKIGSGSTPSGGKNAYQKEGIPLIRSMNVHFGGFKREGLAFISNEQARKLNNVIVEEGDVLLNITGASIGRVTLAPTEMSGARVNQHVCIIRVTDKVLPQYLELCLASPLIQSRIFDVQVGATREALTKAMIEKFTIPVPSLDQQRRIIAKIDDLMSLCDTLEKQIDATTQKQTELLNALLNAKPKYSDNIIDLATYRSVVACYAVNKLANEPYFGRTAAAKVLYLAQAHIGLKLDFHPEREAAGPLDKWIYDFEKQGERNGWFAINQKQTKAGYTKYEHQPFAALQEPAKQAENLMTQDERKKFDQLINLLRDRNTEEVEIIATLFAVWNDFLIDGVKPTDEQIITELRENWHEKKKRFTPAELGKWLNWMRKEKLIPRGLPPRTVQQPNLNFN